MLYLNRIKNEFYHFSRQTILDIQILLITLKQDVLSWIERGKAPILDLTGVLSREMFLFRENWPGELSLFFKQNQVLILFLSFSYLVLYGGVVLFRKRRRRKKIRLYRGRTGEILEKPASVIRRMILSLPAGLHRGTARFVIHAGKEGENLLEGLERIRGKIGRVWSWMLQGLDFAGKWMEKGLMAVKLIEPKIQTGDLLVAQSQEQKEYTLQTEIPRAVREEFEEAGFSESTLDLFTEQKKILQTVAKRWENVSNAGLLIAGKKGSGKTALMQIILKKHLQGREVIKIAPELKEFRESVFGGLCKQISGKDSPEETEAYLQEKENLVIVLDNLHLLFFREPAGFQKFQKWMDLIERTEDRHLWIVSMDEYAFRFISQVQAVGEIFEFQIKMSGVKSEDIRSLFEKKAREAGFFLYPQITQEKLNFLKKKIRKGELKYSEIPDYLLSQYFSKLASVCENVFPALYFYFLHSIAFVRKDQLVLGEIEPIDLGFVEKFPASYFFILTAFYIHESLSISELNRLLGFPREEIFLALSFMEEKKLIVCEKGDKENRYRIHPISLIPLSRILNKKNYLHF
jgi:hypothetical protein